MNKEIEAKYDKLYESYLENYDCDILKRKDFFNILTNQNLMILNIILLRNG